MFKDPDKQREANRQAKARQRRRDSRRQPKGMTSQGTTKGMTVADERPDEPSNVIPEGFVEPEVMVEIDNDGNITPVSDKPKRGKDIKCFEDLPPAAQLAIDTISENEAEHKRRTAIAINYQHQFPDRYHGTGFNMRTFEDGARQPFGAR